MASMSSDSSLSEEALRCRIRDGGFTVALSGGGHRATLATLGCLLALVDRDLSTQIIQIASVSGGSITNAFVAQRTKLEDLKPGDLDSIATDLVTTVVRRGVLTKRWFAVFLLTPIAVGIIFATISTFWLRLTTWGACVVGIVVASVLLLLRGKAVEWLLHVRYFRHGSLTDGRARLSSLSGRKIDHVFCMTDLALGLPVYASSSHGGMIWRRLRPGPLPPLDHPPFQSFSASHLTLAELVRASAAFPGIPPRRIHVPVDPQVELVAHSPRVAFLADGGLWNNLGSQVVREDGFIGTHAAWGNGTLRPYGRIPSHVPLLCFNGSAPLAPTKVWSFQIPGVALARSLLQTTEILNANTVLPRVDSMTRAFERRTLRSLPPDHLDPVDLVADLRPSNDVWPGLLPGTWKRELIRKLNSSVKKWERDALVRLRVAHEHVGTDSNTDWLGYLLGDTEPEGKFPVPGFADIDDWNALKRSDAWKHLMAEYGGNHVTAPTTLGRINAKLAKAIIGRAYLNTYLISLFLAPLKENELANLDDFPARLDAIVALTSSTSAASAT
jgi:hypothetical protein